MTTCVMDFDILIATFSHKHIQKRGQKDDKRGQKDDKRGQ